MMSENEQEGFSIGDVKELVKHIPGALWDGAIEWGKSEAKKGIFVFGLGFFRHLQQAIKKIPPDQRADAAYNLRVIPYEYIEEHLLKQLRLEHTQRNKFYAAIMKSLGELKEFQEGKDFDAPQLLNSLVSLRKISRHNKKEALNILREFKSHAESQFDSLDSEAKTIFRSCKDILLKLDNMEELLIRVNRVILDDNQREFEKKYLKEIKHEYGELQLLGIGKVGGMVLPIDPAFISLSLQETIFEGFRTDEAEAFLSDRDELVIIGPAGAGKSTLLQWEAVQCARGERLPNGKPNPWHNLIPFFIPIRNLGTGEEFPRRCKWVELSVPNWERATDNHGEWIEKVIDEGRALLILDGLDEMSGKNRPGFWRELWKCVRNRNIMYRVSTRPFYIPGENDDQWNPPFNAALVNVLPLSEQKVDLLIDKWHKAAIMYEQSPVKKKLLDKYPRELKNKLWRNADYRKIGELTQTPLLCAAICLINRHSEEKLPQRIPDFYENLCRALLERDERKKRRNGSSPFSETLFDNLDFNVLFHIHSHLAFSMVMNPVGKAETTDADYRFQVEESRVLKWLKDPIDRIQNEEMKELAENNLESLLRHLLNRRNLLRQPGKGLIDFHHRSIQEYLAASAFAMRDWIEFLVQRAKDDLWRNIIILSAGGYMAGAKFGNELIDKLLVKAEKSGSRVYYCLAVACLDTAILPSKEILERTRKALDNIFPPKSLEEAKKLAAAGNPAIPKLKKIIDENNDPEIKSLCSLTLLCIGGTSAFQALGDDLDPDILIKAFINSPPGINILELPPVISRIKKSGKIPEAIMENVIDLAPLSGDEELYHLDLRDCQKFTHLVPLSDMPNLKSLNLEGCSGITDIRSISGLKGIESLNVSGFSFIKNISSFTSSANLTNLNLSYCINLEDLGGISQLKNLRVLSIRGCKKIRDIAILSDLPNLEKLDLGYCVGIRDFSP
ncbi:NACHT domain-containing protein, partial [Candidatus Sumerlaeota bacterium]|nr:NACHT domain-containing protein [Candidatus Sumerlaeota bacterium]